MGPSLGSSCTCCGLGLGGELAVLGPGWLSAGAQSVCWGEELPSLGALQGRASRPGRGALRLCPSSPACRIDLEEWEHVTCMKTVSLKSEETVSGLKGYIAVGTCLMQGEEVTCRGRVSRATGCVGGGVSAFILCSSSAHPQSVQVPPHPRQLLSSQS